MSFYLLCLGCMPAVPSSQLSVLGLNTSIYAFQDRISNIVFSIHSFNNLFSPSPSLILDPFSDHFLGFWVACASWQVEHYSSHIPLHQFSSSSASLWQLPEHSLQWPQYTFSSRHPPPLRSPRIIIIPCPYWYLLRSPSTLCLFSHRTSQGHPGIIPICTSF